MKPECDGICCFRGEKIFDPKSWSESKNAALFTELLKLATDYFCLVQCARTCFFFNHPHEDTRNYIRGLMIGNDKESQLQ